jgi:hypothetical protein
VTRTTVASRGRLAGLLGSLLVTAVAVVLLVPVLASGRRSVELSDLVPAGSAASPAWPDGPWTRDPDVDSSSRGETFGADESLRVAWTRTGDLPGLVLTVHRYGGPLRAEYHYRRSGPPAAFRDNYPAFSAESFSSRSANRSRVVCAAADPGGPCQIWFYWARYGQYATQLRYQGGPKIDAQEFLLYVRHLDDLVSERLK